MTITLERLATTATTATTATVGDLMQRPELQITDDIMADTAMDILLSSGADHLLVRDEGGRCAGLLTRLHLAPFQARSWYTERTPVRDILHDRAPFATADMPAALAAAAMRSRGLDAWPVVDHDGRAIGLLTA
ncbi:HPP family protein [Kitasatospora sp. NBC_00315]|uniref:CBS domain-containing protein n=1 Tax=Kitasatospora sp. NBC_00315 TaxID=2975963 RepID=UPI00324FBF2B